MIPSYVSFLGKYKADILAGLQDEYVEFGYWLYIPKLNTLLSFRWQICTGVEMV
ncbi:MAG: hypothetical protein Q3971_05190 [Moraxella sp.]|nr:hypothetical protein [Moraxella sp.]